MATATTGMARRVLTALGLTLAITMFAVPATHPVAGQDSNPSAAELPASHPLTAFTLPTQPQPDGGTGQAAPPAPTEKTAAKISRDLADLAAGGGSRNLGDADGFNLSGVPLPVYDGWVVIDAIASGDPGDLKAALEILGLQGGAAFGGMVSGRLPIGAIDSLANLASLRFVRPAYMVSDESPIVADPHSMNTNVGLVTSQGDAAMRSDDARTAFGVDGTGVTVGTLASSFDCLGGAAADVASGDLPVGIVVLEERSDCASGTDFGRAMMQLIHDVAPGASQAFHTSVVGQAGFAQGIIDLRNAGADVIVDGVSFTSEPMFQDGVIAQAVDTVVADGVAYFSSAGSRGRNSYQDIFSPGQTFAPGAFPQGTSFAPPFFGGVAHEFGDGDMFQRVTLQPGSVLRISHQWADPAASVCSGCPGPDTDMDIYLLNDPPTVILNGGVAENIGADPMEFVSFGWGGSEPIVVNVMLVKHDGPDPGLMKYIRFDGGPAVSIDEFDTASGTVFGHKNAAGAEAVGAAFYQETPEFGQTPPLLEPYSSAGPTPILFDTSGNPISTVVRDKPEIVAPDWTNTTFFGSDIEPDGFPNFGGTGAAVAHAAGVAALMLDGVPSLPPSEVYSALETTAIDMLGTGFDFDSGFGLIDATGGTMAKLTASDGAAFDLFGNAVATSGDTALVGALHSDAISGDSGSAYVFVRSGNTWNQQVKLTPGDGAINDNFGRSLAISGDTAVIGAYNDDDNGTNSGSAYVFVRNGTTWSQQAKLTASDGAAGDRFGVSVAVSGDTAVVGSANDDDDGTNSGSAYVFVRSGTTWSQQAKLSASDGAPGDWLGYSVAISGETALVGAFQDDDSGTYSGSV